MAKDPIPPNPKQFKRKPDNREAHKGRRKKPERGRRDFDCLKAIDIANMDRLSDDEIETLVERINRVIDNKKALNELEAEILNASEQLIMDAATAAKVAERERLKNIIIGNDLLRRVQEAKAATGDPSLGLEAAMVGVNAPFFRSRSSVDAKSKGLIHKFLGGLIADLERANLTKIFNSGEMDRDVARELWDMSLPTPTHTATDNQVAKKLAKIINKYRVAAIAMENRAGTYIRFIRGYVTRQTHDPYKMEKGGWKNWRAFVYDKVDWERMDMAHVAPKTRLKYLREAYDGLVTAVRNNLYEINEDEFELEFHSSGNLARKESSSRVIHFKDADAWFDYNEVFGRASLNESIVNDLRRSSHTVAMLDTFGSNPRQMFDEVRKILEFENRSNPEIIRRLRRANLEHQFAEIDGTVNIAQNHVAAAVFRNIRTWQSMSKLGGAVLASVTDTITTASELRYQGRSVLKSYTDSFTAVADGMTTSRDRRRVAESIGVGIDGSVHDFMSRFAAQDDVPGRMSKVMSMFFKLNLLGPWTNSVKRGVGLMMANDLARHADMVWSELPYQLKRNLTMYGFDSAAWQMARKAVIEDAQGRKYMAPDALPMAYNREDKKMRDAVSTMIAAYITDRVEFASLTPGARERAMIRMGLQPGTIMGEAIRTLMQFKTFPLAVMSKSLGRDIYGYEGANTMYASLVRGKGDVVGLASFIAGTSLMGMVALQMKEIAKGKEPREVNAAFLKESMVQGGALGLYGDFLLGEANRFGNSPIEALLGPGVGAANDAVDILQKLLSSEAIDGEAPAVGADMVRFVKSNIPFGNLFYAKAAMDYLIWYQITEAVSPGYLSRVERRMRSENEQKFFVPPSSAIPYGGGTRLFEGVR